MKVSDTNFTGGNLTVHTACEGAQPWSIYVPAQVALFRRTPVASRNLDRGEIISSADISPEVVNISQLRHGQLNDYDSILGKEIKRPITQGEAFRSAALDAPMVIKRGDIVNIEIQAGAISVSSQGTAMSHGRVGDRIRVRNSQSDRIVNAQVIASGKVQTTL
jgi:flagella basal body P-ring formation protein FlgA